MNHLYINPTRHNRGELTVTRTLQTSPTTFVAGDILTYELNVTNIGNGIVRDAIYNETHDPVTNVSGDLELATGADIIPNETKTITYDYVITNKDISNWLTRSIPITGEAEVQSSVGNITSNNTSINTLTGAQFIFNIDTNAGNFEPQLTQNVFISIGLSYAGGELGDHYDRLYNNWEAFRNDTPSLSSAPFYIVTNADTAPAFYPGAGKDFTGFRRYNNIIVPENIENDPNAHVIEIDTIDNTNRLVDEIIYTNNLSAGSVVWLWSDEFSDFASEQVKNTDQWLAFAQKLRQEDIVVASSGTHNDFRSKYEFPVDNYLDYHRQVASNIAITTTHREFMLPLIDSGVYDFYVDWGSVDGAGDDITSASDSNRKHEYATAGNYTITITGGLSGWFFTDHNRLKYKSTIDWSALTLIDYNSTAYFVDYNRRDWSLGFPAFIYSANYTGNGNAIGSPNVDTHDLSYMFSQCFSLTADGLNNWDTSNVTDMQGMFLESRVYNEYIGDWDTSSVRYMNDMFATLYEDRLELMSYNQDLNNWDVSNVEDMSNMFFGATGFNNGGQTIDSWRPRNCTDMSGMFRSANAFNRPVNSWGPSLSGVTSFIATFERAHAFNRALDTWDVSGSTSLNRMFNEAFAFNQDLNNWDVSNVRDFSAVFYHAGLFNNGRLHASDPLTTVDDFTWDTSAGEDFRFMFACWDKNLTPTNGSFNQRLRDWSFENAWSVSNFLMAQPYFNTPINSEGATLTECDSTAAMFEGCTSFNQNLDQWDLSNCRVMSRMLKDCISFNNGGSNTLSAWNIEKVEYANLFIDMGPQENAVFTQDIDAWKPKACKDFEFAFRSCTSFNSPLSSWGNYLSTTHTLRKLNFMFSNCSSFNQDLTLWGPRLSAVITTDAMFSGASAFNNGDIAGGSSRPLDWDLYSVGDIGRTFSGCTSFNQSLSYWGDKLGNLEAMRGLFGQAIVYDQDMSSWGPYVSACTDFADVFQSCVSFNQSLANWDIRSANSCKNMLQVNSFYGAMAFSQENYDGMLNGWAYTADSVGARENVYLDVASNITRTNDSLIAYNKLTNDYNWTIVDGGLV
jgi:surface protein